MKPERYELLEKEGLPLTEEEIEAGWLYCNCEWDGMLIHKDWKEAKVCSCLKKRDKK